MFQPLDPLDLLVAHISFSLEREERKTRKEEEKKKEEDRGGEKGVTRKVVIKSNRVSPVSMPTRSFDYVIS